MNLRHFICIILCTFFTAGLQAQNVPIGGWKSYLPYNKVVSIACSGTKLYVAGEQSFFTYDIPGDEITTYSKVNGMTDVGMSYIAYDPATEMAVLAYSNSNIDLFKDDNFYNIPYLKLRTVTGDKKIYHIYIEDGKAYMSTGLGVVVLDMIRKEVKESYIFMLDGQSVPVKSFTADTRYFYAATSRGLYRTLKTNPNIQASSSWNRLDTSRNLLHVAYVMGKTFAATADTVFALESDTLRFAFHRDSVNIQHLDALENGLAISTYNPFLGMGTVYTANSSYALTDSFASANPMQALQTLDDNKWVADMDWGLRSPGKTVIPDGPIYVGAYDILPEGDRVSVAHGSYDDRWNLPRPPNFWGISILDGGKWSSYNWNLFPGFAFMENAIRLAKDPADGTLYVASLTQGLYYLKTDKTAGRYREEVLDLDNVDKGTCRVSGVTFDQKGVLWVTQENAPNELAAKSKDGTWYKFSLDNLPTRTPFPKGAASVIVDDYNQKWFFSPAGGGLLVYNDKGTLDNPADDEYADLVADKTRGNLPENFVQCLVNDKKGAIWIGTTNGIGIISCPDRAISRQCQTEIRVVQYDQFPGQLFAGQNVKTIAVDGANRKWVGTNDGVWLISEDGGKIISRFTAENSPLPSNVIQVIKVDPVTGTVYFGTANGIVSYRGTATDGGVSNKEVKIYPNPVKSGYTGTIAISGLVENADVRITDISGQLVYRTKALGGQAVWNGLDYTGRRPQSGVLMVFVSNSDGSETYTGKMVFIK